MDNRRQLFGGPSRLDHPSLQSTRRRAPSDPSAELPPRWEQNSQANLVPRLQHFDDNEQENILNFSGNPDDADDESEDSGNEDGSEEADDLDRDLDENGQGADADAGENDVEGEEGEEDDEDAQDDELPFNAAAVGLKEISNLASFTVSSYKPGCGVRELRDDDINLFWQSDGPQPHRLNIHFIKRVEIRALRLFLDYELDESYTPTKIQITAGTAPHLTIPFTTMELNTPKGWIDVPIAGAGGGKDGNSLCCFFIRIIVLENHQNGKDTHIRGIKVYALDDSATTAESNPVEDMAEAIDDYAGRSGRRGGDERDQDTGRKPASRKFVPGDGGLTIPYFMRDPEIR
ncbi:anaphase-promoting complex subunit 10 [Apiospora kogelbergensis]|uniref:Anaphase-promoting complex subunit 10 n=1 Tax=Apiospora kogelbergensis TaxID=1337665 RepID=A0AAW0R7R1_9PEZI